MEKYIKVEIKSESDLPKEGKYHFHIRGDASLRFKDVEGASFRQLKKKVDYYLLPISDTELIVPSEEEIEKQFPTYHQNNLMTIVNGHRQEGVKWAISEIKKLNK